MAANKYSPNWYWQQLGYLVTRVPITSEEGRKGMRRIVTRSDMESIVDTGDGSHEDELDAAIKEYHEVGVQQLERKGMSRVQAVGVMDMEIDQHLREQKGDYHAD